MYQVRVIRHKPPRLTPKIADNHTVLSTTVTSKDAVLAFLAEVGENMRYPESLRVVVREAISRVRRNQSLHVNELRGYTVRVERVAK